MTKLIFRHIVVRRCQEQEEGIFFVKYSLLDVGILLDSEIL